MARSTGSKIYSNSKILLNAVKCSFSPELGALDIHPQVSGRPPDEFLTTPLIELVKFN